MRVQLCNYFSLSCLAVGEFTVGAAGGPRKSGDWVMVWVTRLQLSLTLGAGISLVLKTGLPLVGFQLLEDMFFVSPKNLT